MQASDSHLRFASVQNNFFSGPESPPFRGSRALAGLHSPICCVFPRFPRSAVIPLFHLWLLTRSRNVSTLLSAAHKSYLHASHRASSPTLGAHTPVFFHTSCSPRVCTFNTHIRSTFNPPRFFQRFIYFRFSGLLHLQIPRVMHAHKRSGTFRPSVSSAPHPQRVALNASLFLSAHTHQSHGGLSLVHMSQHLPVFG